MQSKDLRNNLIANEAKSSGLDLDSIHDMSRLVESDDEELMEEEETTSSDSNEEDDGYIWQITDEWLEEHLSTLEEYNYVELCRAKRSFQQEKNQVDHFKHQVDAALKMQKDLMGIKTAEELIEKEISAATEEDETSEPSISDQVVLSNMAEEFGLDGKEIKEFLDNYEDSIAKLDRAVEECEKRIQKYDDTPKTSSFMGGEMVDIAEKRLALIAQQETLTPKMKRRRNYYQILKEMYGHRDVIPEYLFQRLDNNKKTIERTYRNLITDLKKGQLDVVHNLQNMTQRALCRVFSLDQMKLFDKYLELILNPDHVDNDMSTFLLEYAIYNLYMDTKLNKTGQYKAIEVIVSNVLDILTDNYDLDGGSDAYDEQLRKLSDHVNQICKYKRPQSS